MVCTVCKIAFPFSQRDLQNVQRCMMLVTLTQQAACVPPMFSVGGVRACYILSPLVQNRG